MKFFKLNSKLQVNVNVSEYLIDWKRKVSKPQKRVKDFLFPYWKTHVVLEEFRIPGSLLRCDLMNLTRKIIIEVSPAKTHSEFNKFFFKDRFKWCDSLHREFKKEEWAKSNGFILVEIFDEDMEKLSKQWFQEKYKITL